MLTSNVGIWTPDNSDQYALTQDLARTADDVDEELIKRVEAKTGTGDPGTLFGREFDRYRNTSTGATYTHTNGQWVPDKETISGAGFFGAPPPATAPIIQYVGSVLVSTNANGDTFIDYPRPFPNGVISVSLSRHNYSIHGAMLYVIATTQSLSRLNFRLYSTTGEPLPNYSAVQFSYCVWGW